MGTVTFMFVMLILLIACQWYCAERGFNKLRKPQEVAEQPNPVENDVMVFSLPYTRSFRDFKMGYLNIDNLHINQDILLFKECYAMEKINGTSAHIKWDNDRLTFFSGGVDYSNFVSLFEQGKSGPGNKAMLEQAFKNIKVEDVTVYGEAYGGSCQKKSDVYGKELRFVAFDVRIGDCWLSVPQAEDFCKSFSIEFVSYVKIPTKLTLLDAARDAPSEQARRNGLGEDKQREGVVLRPLIEVTKNDGTRIICKYKIEKCRETKTPRQVDPAKLKVLSDAEAVAEEWVTEMRLTHVLDKLCNPGLDRMKDIIIAMCEDVKREGRKEIVWSKPVQKAICRNTANMFKRRLQNKLRKLDW